MRKRALLLIGIVAGILVSAAGWGQPASCGAVGVTGITGGMPVLSLPVGHREEVSAVAYSSTGRLLLSGSFDGTARLWDVASGAPLRTFTHGEAIRAVAFSPDDRCVATAGLDDATRIWDTSTGTLLHILEQSSQVNSVAFSPDGTQVITGGDDGAWLWSAASGTRVRLLSAFTVKSVAISRTTGLVAFGDAGGGITLLDLAGTTTPPRTLREHDAWVWSLAFSPDGRLLLSGGNDGTVRLWDVVTRTTIRIMQARANVWAVAFSPDASLVAAGSEGGGPELWRASTGETAGQMDNEAAVYGLAFEPGGGALAAVGEDQSVRIWSPAERTLIKSLSAQPAIVGLVAASPDSRFLYTADEQGRARVWDLRAGSVVVQTTGRAGQPQGAAFSADGEVLVAAADDEKSVEVWSIPARIRRPTLQATGTRLLSCAISPDGGTIVTGDEEGTVRVWDVRSQRRTRELTGHTGPVNAVAWIEGTRRVVSGSDDGTARIWDVDAGTELGRLQHQRKVRFVAAAAQGTYVATSQEWSDGDNDGTFLWDASGNQVRKLRGTGAVAFGPGAGSLFTASGADVLQFEVPTGNLVRQLDNNMAIEGLAVSRDGRLLLTSDTGNTVWVWDLATGERLRSLRGRDGYAGRSVGWTWDGRLAVTGGGAIKIFDPESGKEVKAMPEVFGSKGLAVSSTGIVCATAPGSAPRLWSLDGTAELPGFEYEQAEFEGVSLSAKGDRMVSHGFGALVYLWDVVTGRQLRSFTLPDGVMAAAISPDGRQAIAGTIGHEAWVLNLDHGTLVRTLSDETCEMELVDWSAAGDRILTAGEDVACVWDAASDTRLQRVAFEMEGASNAQFSPDGKTILINSGIGKRIIQLGTHVALVIDSRTGKVIANLSVDGAGVYASAPLAGSSIAAIANNDGTIALVDWSGGERLPVPDPDTVRAGKDLARLIYLSPESWAVIAPASGQFDTNDIEGLHGLHWVFPDDPLTPLAPEVFVRDFFEPRLLPRILSGNNPGAVGSSLAELNRIQPKVAIDEVEWIDAAAGRARVTITVARGCPAGDQDQTRCAEPYDLRLFRNGQLVGWAPAEGIAWQEARRATDDRDAERESWRRLTQLEVNADGRRRLSFEVQVPRLPSLGDVTLSAYAFNVDRVRSAIAIKRQPLPAALRTRKGNAYVVTVGVNRTASSPAWDLNYAANDARDLAMTVIARLDPAQFSAVRSVVLVSDRERLRKHEGPATSAALHAVLDRLAGRPPGPDAPATFDALDGLEPASPEDVVILALSSHGYTDKQGVFHFVLAETDQPQEVTPALDAVTLTSDQLSAWLREVDAGELLLIVDACHSEAVVQPGDFKPGPMGSRGLGQLAYDKGMRVLAASKAGEAAFERLDLKNGVLTYALVRRGLDDGKADFQPPGDGIALGEWLAYAEQEVPRLFREGDARGSVANGQGSRDAFRGRRRTSPVYQQPVVFDFAKSVLGVTLSPANR